ncbi:hypothetical protein WJ23_23150 [Burkholderia lata]|nr:hypothetical protein WJ23_23150 [Burkholderia lata]
MCEDYDARVLPIGHVMALARVASKLTQPRTNRGELPIRFRKQHHLPVSQLRLAGQMSAN